MGLSTQLTGCYVKHCHLSQLEAQVQTYAATRVTTGTQSYSAWPRAIAVTTLNSMISKVGMSPTGESSQACVST